MRMSVDRFVVPYVLSFGTCLYYWYYRTMVDLAVATSLSGGELVIAGALLNLGGYVVAHWFYASYSALMNSFTTMY